MDRTIFISNLHSKETSASVYQIFAQHGSIIMSHVFKDDVGRCKGYGVVTFSSIQERDTVLHKQFFSLSGIIRVQEYIQDSQKLEDVD